MNTSRCTGTVILHGANKIKISRYSESECTYKTLCKDLELILSFKALVFKNSYKN